MTHHVLRPKFGSSASTAVFTSHSIVKSSRSSHDLREKLTLGKSIKDVPVNMNIWSHDPCTMGIDASVSEGVVT